MIRFDSFFDARASRPGRPFNLGVPRDLDVPCPLEQMAGRHARAELPKPSTKGQQRQC
jgi:hypothetical protein